jgi:hypothetical protein
MCDMAQRGLAPSLLLHAKAAYPQGIYISMKAGAWA